MRTIPPLTRYKKLRRELQRLKVAVRFARKSIRVADIANQYYCEKQVELRMIHGQKETTAMRRGTEGHEEAVRFASKVSSERAWNEAWRKNRRKPYEIANFHLLVKHDGVFIVGVPDHSILWKGKALLVRELKFRSRVSIYETDFVQLRLYGLLLAGMGFDTSGLECEVICLSQKMRRMAAFYDLEIPNVGKITNGSNKQIKRNPFNMEKAKRELEWALEFWRGEREPLSTDFAGKCRACSFCSTCPDSRT